MVAGAKQLLLPVDGVEFEVAYFDGEEEIRYGDRPHTSVSAVSPGLKVTVAGPDSWVAQQRQQRPYLRPGHSRTMLVIRHGQTWIHVLGDHVLVTDRRLRVGEVTPGLTELDKAILKHKRKALAKKKED